jgi:integrase
MKGSTIRRGATWTAYWSATDHATGQRRQHSKGGFRTQKEARTHLNTVLPKVDAGTWAPDSGLSVEQLLTEWLAAKTSEGLRPATISLYRMAGEAWISPQIGALEARQLTAARVGELVERLRSGGSTHGRGPLSSRSVQIAVQVLKAATRWAFETALLSRDPLAGYRRPRSTSKTMAFWDASEAKAFLEFVRDDRMAAIWALFLTRGPRRGEVAGLRWDAIDLEAGQIRITDTRVLVDGHTQASAPKTERGRRPLSLDPRLISLLRSHRVRQSTEKLAAGDAYDDGGWLVCDELGRPWYPDTISERFDTLVKASGLRRIRLHDTRHTAATLMLSAGQPVHVVAAILGHDPTETLRTYAHVIPGGTEAAGAGLSAALLG